VSPFKILHCTGPDMGAPSTIVNRNTNSPASIAVERKGSAVQ